MSNFMTRIGKILPRIPYSKSNYGDALKELITILLFGFMPIWLSVLFSWLSKESSPGLFIKSFLSSGEALLMSSALVGPLVYILFKKYGDLPKKITIRFPFGWFYIILIFLVCVVTASVFGHNSASQEEGRIQEDNMQFLSATMLAVSFAVLFFVSTIRNYIDDPTKIMHGDTEEFLKEWD